MLTTGNQLKAARALANVEQTELAQAARIHVNTIRSMESSGAETIGGRSANVQAVQRVLEALGVEFLNHGRPGVRMNGPISWRRTRDGDVPPDGVEVTINYKIGNQQVHSARFDSKTRTWALSNSPLTLLEREVLQWTPRPGPNDANEWASEQDE